MRIAFGVLLMLLTACNRPDGEGAGETETTTNAADVLPGNPPPPERGPGQLPPGSGRLDQGGGRITTSGTNPVIWTNSVTGETNAGPASGTLPR